MDILQHITPTCISNFVGNRMLVTNINKWLQQAVNKANMTKNILCIMGPDGSGKTILSTLLLKKHDFHVLEIGKDVLTNDNIKTSIDNFTNNTTIEHYIFKRQKIIFIDDLDILMCIDRNIVSKIIAFNKVLKQKKICLVATCNSNIDKKLFSENDAEYFRLTYPSCKDSFSYIMHILDEKQIEYDMEHLLQVVNKHKGNIRESVLNLQNTETDLHSKSLERAFKDMNHFEMAKSILSKKSTTTEIDHLVKGDIGNLPYIIYENLPTELDANYKSCNIIDAYLNVNSYFIDAVAFDEHAYSSLDWSLLQYSNTLRTKSITSVLDSCDLKVAHKNLTYKFSQLRSKSSHKKILGKKTKTTSQQMQTSERTLLVAADTLARNETNKTSKQTKSSGRNNTQEMTCLISTYEKYFV